MNATHRFETKVMFTGIEHSDAVLDYIAKKLESAKKILAGEHDGMAGLFRVEVGRTSRHHRTGDVFRAEINFECGKHYSVRAVSERDNLYAALDDAKDELDRELKKVRKKRFTLVKRGGMAFKNMMRRFGG
jgi:ribosomal subunit interface protein